MSTPGYYTLTFITTDLEGLDEEKILHVHLNCIPIITANNQIVTKGDGFNPMSIINVTNEDANIMYKVIVSSEEITPTIYNVTYTITDSIGAKAKND